MLVLAYKFLGFLLLFYYCNCDVIHDVTTVAISHVMRISFDQFSVDFSSYTCIFKQCCIFKPAAVVSNVLFFSPTWMLVVALLTTVYAAYWQ